MPSSKTTNASSTSWLDRWTALMALVLLGSTWPLWSGKGEFPAIPFIGGLRAVPGWVDGVCLTGLLCGLIAVLLVGKRKSVAQPIERNRLGWGLVLMCGLMLVALDQHRLQPWFYQLLFFSAICCLCQPQRSGQLLTWIVVSIYFFSALGKFDFEFLHTVGQQFWDGAMKLIGSEPAPPTQTSIARIALLPIAELVLALGLAFRPTRMIAGGLACVFHALLMLVLGPLGLNHSWGVFFWNLQFAGQACLLFVWPQVQVRLSVARGSNCTAGAGMQSPTAVVSKRQTWNERLATLIAVLVIALPTLERMGWWDHWTSWALYAPHSSRVEVWIASSAVDKLPPSLQQLMVPQPQLEALWVRLPLERWSLAVTGSPIYPQARFQMGVALALAHHIESEFELKAIVRGVAARWDGRRWSREVEGTSNISRAAQTWFWVNTQPRQ